jgi:excisionase family DNA binding protein
VGEDRTSSNRLSVYEAAEVMGVTVDAIRKRVSRGTIPHERDDDGRVWVLLDTDQDAASKVQDTDQPQSASDVLISEMRDRIASLERQLEQERQANSEHRRLLAAALERIPPQLEAPQESSEPRESPGTVEEEPERTEPRPDTLEPQTSPQRPWWRRMFGR